MIAQFQSQRGSGIKKGNFIFTSEGFPILKSYFSTTNNDIMPKKWKTSLSIVSVIGHKTWMLFSM